MMFERFTERARRIIILAQEEAERLNHSAVGTEHILLGIIREGEGVASKVFERLNISPERVRAEIEGAIGRGERSPHDVVAFTPRAKKALDLALDEARRLGHNYIGTEHLLLGLIREGECVAARVLEAMGADLDRAHAQVVYLLDEDGRRNDVSAAPLDGSHLDVDERVEGLQTRLVHLEKRVDKIAGEADGSSSEVIRRMTWQLRWLLVLVGLAILLPILLRLLQI